MKDSPTHFDPGPWNQISFVEGIRTIEVSDFESFFHFVNRFGANGTDDRYLWRGQKCAKWEITSTLGRSCQAHHEDLQLGRFADAVRRCTNIEYDISTNNQDIEKTKLKLWSLGQHWGLLTPLIDFTVYPYFALFFAFADPVCEGGGFRAVFALNVGEIRFVNFEISNLQGIQAFRHKLDHPPYDSEFQAVLLGAYEGIHKDMREMVVAGRISEPVKTRIFQLQLEKEKRKELKVYSPSSKENERIHSQGGCHVYTPNNVSIEAWVRTHWNPTKGGPPLLTKILVPDKEREMILTSLNKMNVNFMTLFPDFEGAAKHCNLALERRCLGNIRDY